MIPTTDNEKREGAVDNKVKLGCAAGGCLSLLIVLIGAALAVFYLPPTPVEEVKKKKPRAEVIKYKDIKNRKNGPTSVKPSGRSGLKLKTPRGVIDFDAEEVTEADEISYPNRPKICRNNAHITDIIKDVAFNIDKEMRKGASMSIKEERKLGKSIARQLREHPRFLGKVDTPASRKWRKYIGRVSQPLLAEIKRKGITYHFHTIDSDIVNAFAIPGGHIYFYTGLLERVGGQWLSNEAQLAGILAHEISHVDLEHCVAVFQYLKRIGVKGSDRDAATVLTLARGPFSSNQEDEADENATRILHNAQYDPDQFVEMWKTWDKLQPKRGEANDDIFSRELKNLMQSHSPPRKRACTVLRSAQDIMPESPFSDFYVGRENFERRVPRTRTQF